MIAQTYNSNLF